MPIALDMNMNVYYLRFLTGIFAKKKKKKWPGSTVCIYGLRNVGSKAFFDSLCNIFVFYKK